jgi:transcriptional regulator with XRE-family HTH domain
MDNATREQRLTSAAQVVELLRQRRKARKKTQGDLAVALGVSQARFSLLENNPDQLTLDRLLTLVALLDLELVVRERTAKKPRSAW